MGRKGKLNEPWNRTCRLIRSAACVMVLSAAVLAEEREPAATEAQVRFFETHIRPLLVEHCIACHGPDKQQGNLRLDSKERLLRGGDLGPAVTRVPFEESLLLKAIGYQDESLQMPPKGKLSEQQIADITAWVQAGVPYPLSEISETKREASAPAAKSENLWAFQKPVRPSTPDVVDQNWPQAAVDRFVLTELEEQGLSPALPADRQTLLRRITFDLIGLPPTPAERHEFLEDESPDALARLTDRLLASSHYGERWGRHWLDVVRYADSNGLDENIAFGNAWRYRDYVIAAFNQDKPYDQFLVEQLAGDLLPVVDDHLVRKERLVATGFLALGPKVLAEVDERKMEMDIIDEQLDTFGRAILGLTLGCARCHDHKFDPIGTDDYYALAGIFKSTRTMEHFKKVARWHENELATEAELAQKKAVAEQVAARQAEIAERVKSANERLQSASPDQTLPKDAESLYPPETKDELKRLRDELAVIEKLSPQLPTALGVSEGTVTNLAIHIRGNHLSLGKTVPRGFPKALVGDTSTSLRDDRSGREELARWLIEDDHPLTSRVFVNRLWRWHFGQGLVRSPDNFGGLGEAPSHPLLLDWLARRLSECRWSIKSLHRQLVLTSTYQMSTAHNSEYFMRDPTNRWLWRMDVRRLEAEEICDAVRMVSGTLDETMGGSLLHVANRGYLFDHTSKDLTKYDSSRRAVYFPVIRNNLYDVFQLFDAPDASVLNGDRNSTTVAPQALFMLNSDLIAQSAERLAADLLASTATETEQRLAELYLRLYARQPTVDEQSQLANVLVQLEQAAYDSEPDYQKRRRQAWTRLCHVLLAANEFIYLN